MSPKSSDGEKKEEFFTEADPMETSMGVESSSLGKRQAETYPSNTEDEEEEVKEEEEDSDSDWDKDSFEGRAYHSSDDQADYKDPDFERKNRFFHRTVIETKGFFQPSDNFPGYFWSEIVPVRDLDQEIHPGLNCRQFLANMASLCLEKFNKRKEKNVKFEHILRANFNPGGMTKYYITFAARESDSPDAPLVEYQAKAARCAGKTYPILCRPSPPPLK